STNVIVTTAEATNASFPKEYEPPYKPGTKVTEFTTTKPEVFVRVHGSSNKVGGWVMSESAVRGLSPAEIQAKYSPHRVHKFSGLVG
ncbi:MAG: hypothetical protein M3Z80_08130, partial [Apibacter sp.]|uniref:hypothetical protein n=1 Tax=Apibacter sp. TaxID=2023709 RepID=UPI0025EE8FF7